MKKCELCNSLAKMYCESDQAMLCWDCDSSVHGANFLVAKHLRILLCHLCQSPTPWNGTGPKLGPTVSVCDNCVDRHDSTEEIHNYDTRDEREDDDDDDDEDEDSGDDGEDSGGDEENQVVPLSSTQTVSGSSTSEECATRFGNRIQGSGSRSRTVRPWKHMCDNVDPFSRVS